MMSRLVEPRSKKGRGIYIICAAIVLLFALFVASEGIQPVLLYLLLLGLCVLQFARPTILGWFVLTASFSSYAIGIMLNFRQLPANEFMIFLPCGLMPSIGLLVAWPRRFQKVAE
jgi:hypothetical protein